MTNLIPQSSSSERLSDEKKKIWPFREPVTKAEAIGFYLSMFVAAAGVVIGGIEGSLAFVAISVMLGALTFQEYWARIERLGKIDTKMDQMPSAAREAVEQGFEAAVKRIAGIEVFANQDESYESLADGIRRAREKFDIIGAGLSDSSYKDSYRIAQDHALLEKKLISRLIVPRFRDIQQLEWLKQRIEKHKNSKFYVGWLLNPPENQETVTCVIVDEEEVHFGRGFLGDPDTDSKGMMIRSREVGRAFTDYFNRLWNMDATIKLKDNRGIHQDRIDEVRRRLESAAQDRSTSQVLAFQTRESSYASLLDDLRQAQRLIEIISYRQLTIPDSLRQDFYAELRRAMKRGVQHRRIVWNLNHLAWLEECFAKGWDKLKGFCVRFLSTETSCDLATFGLIDERIISLGHGWRGSGHLRIESAEAASFFKGYFQSRWDKAEETIKEYDKPPDLDLLARLKERLADQDTEPYGGTY